MPREVKQAKRLTISVTEDNYNRLQKLAHDEDRSLSWLASKAIEKFLLSKEANSKEELRGDG